MSAKWSLHGCVRNNTEVVNRSETDNRSYFMYNFIMKEPQTLFEEEEQQRKKLERQEYLKKLIGVKKVPRIISGIVVNCINTAPEELLKKGGYSLLPNKSWERKFGGVYRYHAYIHQREKCQIEIHTDKYKIRDGKKFHIASTFKCRIERKRLKGLVPSKNSIKKELKRNYKKEIFTGEKLREALARMKEVITV